MKAQAAVEEESCIHSLSILVSVGDFWEEESKVRLSGVEVESG